MGGQGMERREILRYIGIASIAGTYPGFSKWVFACPQGHSSSVATNSSPHEYRPLFFSLEHYRMVEHIADMIIPEDDTLGAKQAGVAEFIDFMVANRVPVRTSREVRSTEDAIEIGNEAQSFFLIGLDWINARCHSEFGRTFMDCSSEQQNRLLEELAYKSKFQPTTESGRAFFQMMRDYTVVGYFTTRIGLESLGYPGLRTHWPKMPGCAHPGNPEHANLPKPEDAKTLSPRSAV